MLKIMLKEPVAGLEIKEKELPPVRSAMFLLVKGRLDAAFLKGLDVSLSNEAAWLKFEERGGYQVVVPARNVAFIQEVAGSD